MTPREILRHFDPPTVNRATKKGEITMYKVLLNNKQVTFDQGIFEDLESALNFAKGRGDSYNVHINDLPLSCDGLNFDYYNGFNWERVTIEQIKDLL